MDTSEDFISVDIEASGPVPSLFSMLSIGACLVRSPEDGFYAELKPINSKADPEAIAVSGLHLATLQETGLPPALAMSNFADWIANVSSPRQAIFVGFNACFDWTFVNWYFHRYIGVNPFGHAALDIKSYYMGLEGTSWHQTSMSRLPNRFLPGHALTHHALDDAKSQAVIFSKMMASKEPQT